MSDQIPNILAGAALIVSIIALYFTVRSEIRKDKLAAAQAIEGRVRKEIEDENRLKELEDEIHRRDNKQEGHK
ncbi:MAG: hypothetical protein QOH56_2789 [Pseudonocardiales bacterium]|jgi:hypothetical protein|nr:hypothetical protein [Pseudonocardiales bacterium]